jgi:hypothetical membrane protein
MTEIVNSNEKQKIQFYAICGIIAPVLFLILLIVASILRPGYSPVHNFVSDLGVGSNAFIQNINFMIFGLLSIGLALGLKMSYPQGKISFKVGVWLTILFGLFVLLAGVFPENYLSGGLHTSVSAFAFLSIIAAQLLVWRGLKNAEYNIWGLYRTYCLLSGLLSIIFLILLQISILDFVNYQGTAQRLFLAVPWIWIGITGLKIYYNTNNLT